MRGLLTTLAEVIGAALITVGAYLVAEPAGFIAAGGFLIAGSVLVADQ
jgi:hypothetical protein